MKKTIISTWILFSILVICLPLTAQVRLQSDPIAGGGLSFEYWKAEDDNVMQIALPITYIIPYSPAMRLYAITSPAFSNWNESLTGLSDIKLGGHYLLPNKQWLLTFGLNLPTGKSALTFDEYQVASVLSLPALNFRVPIYGQGLDLQFGINTARQMGDYVIGAGITLLKKGGYEPYKDVDDKYSPGDEISLTLGAERKATLLGKDMKLTGDLLYSIYMKDEYADQEVFKSGNRLLIQLMSQFEMDEIDMMIFIRNRTKGKNKSGLGDIVTERKNSNANQLDIEAQGAYPYSKDLRVKGIVDVKFYSKNDYDTGGATLFGFGGGGVYQLAPNMKVNGELRMYFGSLKSVENTGVFGFKIYGGIQYTL